MHKLLLVFFTFAAAGLLQAQDSETALRKADSLFTEKKYTESFDIYQQLFSEQELYTPAMLLKMAFIREGLGDYTRALYYLNLYYRQTANKAALKKMDDLADEYQLKGYEFDDLDFFLSIYHKYFSLIIYLLLASAMAWLAYMYYLHKKKGEKPLGLGIAFGVTMVVLAILINFGDRYRKAIINNPASFIMEAPSAGADLIEVAGKGHRVLVLDDHDVWTKIRWDDQNGYIRSRHLTHIKTN